MLKTPLYGSLLLLVLLGSLAARATLRVGVHQGYSPIQQIAFSHRIHAGDAKVPCQYCHFTAARGPHAGIPPSGVCMNCHALLSNETRDLQSLRESVEQERSIAWVKVHHLPDFVHFDHSRHVLAAVACRECHGAVERMERVRQDAPLTMGWCLGCHRTRRVGETAAGTDCGRCHY
jgi:uncharacterized paraquat-inducible protein A